MIEKYKISKNSYLYAKQNPNNEWIVTEGKSKKFDKLFLTRFYAKNNISELSDSVQYKIELAPAILVLTKEEKFKDEYGNVIEIEVRGERQYDKCYFNVHDIASGFSLPNLYTTIIDKYTSAYLENVHYCYFKCAKKGNPQNSKIKISNQEKTIFKKILYLTYTGLLKVLFSSRSLSAGKVIKWAAETLFVTHLGTTEQKTKLAGDLVGASAESVKAVFSKTARSLPCIYLFSLGTVEHLRSNLKIDDKYNADDIVYKFGLTNDLERRTKDHKKTYGESGADLNLTVFGYIDPQYVYEAETDLKHHFKELGYMLSHTYFKELVVIPHKKVAHIKKIYSTLTAVYAGHIAEVNASTKLLKETHSKDLALKEIELTQKDLIIKDKDLTIKDMQIEIMKKDALIASLMKKTEKKKKNSV